MAVKIDAVIGNIPVSGAYISILRGPQHIKVYTKDANGNVAGSEEKSFFDLGGALTREDWINGRRFDMSHTLVLPGFLTRAQVYAELKKLNIKQLNLDFTKAVDVLEA